MTPFDGLPEVGKWCLEEKRLVAEAPLSQVGPGSCGGRIGTVRKGPSTFVLLNAAFILSLESYCS